MPASLSGQVMPVKIEMAPPWEKPPYWGGGRLIEIYVWLRGKVDM